MSKPLDVLLVTPPSRVQVYQELSRDFAAIEPPVWSGLIATYLRQQSCSVAILDAEAQGLTHQQTAEQIAAIAPRLAVFVLVLGIPVLSLLAFYACSLALDFLFPAREHLAASMAIWVVLNLGIWWSNRYGILAVVRELFSRK